MTMLPSELKLASLLHCYVHLPEAFVTKNLSSLKTGAIISLKSVQTDLELLVSWNGQLTPGHYAQIDYDFAQANKFQDELIILSLADSELPECSLCRVELIENKDYTIISQHSDANVLDHCKLVSVGLVIPIWFSEHVKVLVKVLDVQPGKDSAILTKWTEMQFQHNLEKVPQPDNIEEVVDSPILNPIQFVSFSLGLGYKPRFNLGSMLIIGDKGCGKTYYLKRILNNYKKYHNGLFNCKQLRGKRPETIKKQLMEMLMNALDNQPSILGLDDIDSFVSGDSKHDDEKGQEAIYRKRLVDAYCHMVKELERSTKGHQVLIIATCRSLDSLDERLSKSKGRQYFAKIVKIGVPDLLEREEIIKAIAEDHKRIKFECNDEQLETIAKRTQGYMPLDLRRIVERAIINACSRSLLDFSAEQLTLRGEDLLDSLNGYTKSSLRGVALQPKTTKNFDNVGGMSKIKDQLIRTILLPIKYPKLFKKSPLRMPTSVLLYGPPGCGKTLIAEALTNQESINSICVRGPELLSKYIGASEGAVRNLFKRAELAKPCMIFFDEFESLVPKRGADSTGVTDRVVNQFLTLMDGVEKLSDQIFIVAATSRPDMIDPAILRPGRLDKHIYCPLPDLDDRFEILRVLSKDMTLEHRDLQLTHWSKELEGFTGADIQSFLYSAQLGALHEIVGPTQFHSRDERQQTEPKKSEFEILVKQSHLQAAFDGIRRDVLERHAKLLNQYPATIRSVNKLVSTRATLA